MTDGSTGRAISQPLTAALVPDSRFETIKPHLAQLRERMRRSQTPNGQFGRTEGGPLIMYLVRADPALLHYSLRRFCLVRAALH